MSSCLHAVETLWKEKKKQQIILTLSDAAKKNVKTKLYSPCIASLVCVKVNIHDTHQQCNARTDFDTYQT